MTAELTHFDRRGRARMVDIQHKADSHRIAVAEGKLEMSTDTLARLDDNRLGKGDACAVARIAGIQAAKQTAQLIPLCHGLGLTLALLDFKAFASPERGWIGIRGRAEVTGKTGVEMEALTMVSVAALTLYDMCKAGDKTLVIAAIHLLHKSGGRSGRHDRPTLFADWPLDI